MEKYFKALEGISYAEWTELKLIIDGSFEAKKNKMLKTLEITGEEDLREVMGYYLREKRRVENK